MHSTHEEIRQVTIAVTSDIKEHVTRSRLFIMAPRLRNHRIPSLKYILSYCPMKKPCAHCYIIIDKKTITYVQNVMMIIDLNVDLCFF